MKRERDGWPVCGACEKELGTERDAFLCAKCLRELPGKLRSAVMVALPDGAYQARSDALAHLGVAPERRRMCLPPLRKEAPEPPRCNCGSKYRVRQANFITGTDDTICDECGKKVYEPPRRVVTA